MGIFFIEQFNFVTSNLNYAPSGKVQLIRECLRTDQIAQITTKIGNYFCP